MSKGNEKERVATVTNARTGLSFAVVVVPTGAAYGLEDCLTNDGGLMVEFYDTRFPHTEHGQFVSRYYASTLLPWKGGGLCLDGGVPNWSLDAGAMREAMDAVVSYLVQRKAS